MNNVIDFIFDKEKCKDLTTLVNCIKASQNDCNMDSVISYLVPEQFINELNSFSSEIDVEILIGNTLRDLKCIVHDQCGRKHSCFITYIGQNKLKINSTSLPYASFQSIEYRHLEEIVQVFKEYINSLENYFIILEKIDRCCRVMEPNKPTFKDNFRKILLGLYIVFLTI